MSALDSAQLFCAALRPLIPLWLIPRRPCAAQELLYLASGHYFITERAQGRSFAPLRLFFCILRFAFFFDMSFI